MTAFEGRLERERIHFNRMVDRAAGQTLVMLRSNIQRYVNPPSTTPYPLEYAYHLLGDIRGKNVVDLGCGDGLNTVILAAAGAKVISVDISDKSLELTGERVRANNVSSNVTLVHSDAATIPVEDGSADRVLCAAILHHVDCVATARQIRRILKPGGIAVFTEPMAGPKIVGMFKHFIPKTDGVSDDEQPLTLVQVHAVSRAVGTLGRRREFGLTVRFADRAGNRWLPLVRTAHRLDAWLLRTFPCTRAFASPLVWEACKEA